jgi:hypothetical protein
VILRLAAGDAKLQPSHSAAFRPRPLPCAAERLEAVTGRLSRAPAWMVRQLGVGAVRGNEPLGVVLPRRPYGSKTMASVGPRTSDRISELARGMGDHNDLAEARHAMRPYARKKGPRREARAQGRNLPKTAQPAAIGGRV